MKTSFDQMIKEAMKNKFQPTAADQESKGADEPGSRGAKTQESRGAKTHTCPPAHQFTCTFPDGYPPKIIELLAAHPQFKEHATRLQHLIGDQKGLQIFKSNWLSVKPHNRRA